jgi:hypothetical protein
MATAIRRIWCWSAAVRSIEGFLSHRVGGQIIVDGAPLARVGGPWEHGRFAQGRLLLRLIWTDAYPCFFYWIGRVSPIDYILDKAKVVSSLVLDTYPCCFQYSRQSGERIVGSSHPSGNVAFMSWCTAGDRIQIFPSQIWSSVNNSYLTPCYVLCACVPFVMHVDCFICWSCTQLESDAAAAGYCSLAG